ncbi:hypothetical protein ACF3M2_13935 [Tissierella carlieri]|uniref:hypothetical protein n=1 Tax=Tissierella carlieri TaxID=689904 RepID=UPI00386E1F83
MKMSTGTTFKTNDIWELKNKEWKENIDYVRQTLTPRALAYFIPILDMGREQCKSIIELNTNFYSSPYFTNIRTELLTFSIMRLFDEKYLPKNFPYKVEPTTINRINKYTTPILNIGNIDINLLKAYSRNRVDARDRDYLKNRCKGNNVLKGQLDLFNDDGKVSRLHGVVTYNLDNNWDNFKFIDLAFFDSTLKEVIVKVDLLKTLQIYGSDDISKEQKSLVNEEDLRQEIQNELQELKKIDE